MVEGGGGATFPVIFYDGEREMNIGNIRIQPLLEFKTFQLMISQKIGISPNQISIYLVHRKSSPDDRQKTPITGKVNFALIVRQKDCYFLVILKRSRKSRNRKLRPNSFDYSDYFIDNDFSSPPPVDNFVLLRRNQPEMDLNGLHVAGYQTPFYDQISQAELTGLNDRLLNLKIEKENYAMAMGQPPNFVSPNLAANAGPNLNHILDQDAFPIIQETMTKTVTDSTKFVVCEECVSPNSSKAEAAWFHHCVNDPIIAGFRAWAGPVAPPAKASG